MVKPPHTAPDTSLFYWLVCKVSVLRETSNRRQYLAYSIPAVERIRCTAYSYIIAKTRLPKRDGHKRPTNQRLIMQTEQPANVINGICLSRLHDLYSSTAVSIAVVPTACSPEAIRAACAEDARLVKHRRTLLLLWSRAPAEYSAAPEPDGTKKQDPVHKQQVQHHPHCCPATATSSMAGIAQVCGAVRQRTNPYSRDCQIV